ncbi:Heat shock protein Hsp20 [Desulfosarcina cetonica]|uniref:Hsp20/alpha crystallin family protein n=1 Tax=Desulfosarcina cetonica TaxID=90730 RepID=UPI0006CF3E94|nr:Hsp20/alpha crystallin family protein [Desulfosarcina cetonica]VTR70206.1 Heat shock protein Hsp20 [Desulfosarcina cetonica]
MELVKFNPTGRLNPFRRRMDTLFDDFFGDLFRGEDEAREQLWNPKVDIFEEDDQYVVKAELPGVEKDKITIDVNGRVLTVKGDRANEKEVKEKNYYRRECSYGTFQRSFTLPDETDSEKIKAEYKDGILKVNIPKPETRQAKKIAVE